MWKGMYSKDFGIGTAKIRLIFCYASSSLTFLFLFLLKTTQIPQFILEENLSSAKIVVAQPRRLAATGVAGRVAEERGESRPGVESVGYVVRGDTAVCNDTRLLFCTFGILLRQLQSDGALDNVSHIVIDEVHERCVMLRFRRGFDFLLHLFV